jgi:(2Fe-2S) ferredoxin
MMNQGKYRVFVCTKQRHADDPEGCCRSCGGMEIYQAFQTEIQHRQLTDRVEIRQSGCLDRCESGPVALVISPQQNSFAWLPVKVRMKLRKLLFSSRHTYGNLTPSHVSEIVQKHLTQGQPLTQLEI